MIQFKSLSISFFASFFILTSLAYAGPQVSHKKSKAEPVQLSQIYSKDSKHVYMKSVDYSGILKDADPKTFVLLKADDESAYTKDKKRVFFFSNPVVEADPATFVALNARYGKDAKHVFFMEKVLDGPDLSSFKTPFVNVWYAVDKDHVYDYGRIISQADPTTFQVVSGDDKPCGEGCFYRAEDKNFRYDYKDKIVQKK